MPVIVQCEACGVRLRASEKLMGKRLRCRCGAAVPMPPDPMGPEVADLSGLIDEISPIALSCPSCGAAMDISAVLCTGCGFNKQTGKRVKSAVVAKTPPPGADSKNKNNRRVAKEAASAGAAQVKRSSGLGWKLFAAAIAVAVLLGAAWFLSGWLG